MFVLVFAELLGALLLVYTLQAQCCKKKSSAPVQQKSVSPGIGADNNPGKGDGQNLKMAKSNPSPDNKDPKGDL